MDVQPLQVKYVGDASDGLIEILSVPYGGPLAGGKDWSGEYFSPRTNLHLDMFPGSAKPLLYDHGTDEMIGWDLIGKAMTDTIRQDDLGWWVQAQLDRHGKYYTALKALIDKQALYGSTGAPTALVRKAADGEILDWPWFEQTLTPIPCNILSRVTPAMAKKHADAAGLTLPEVIIWQPTELSGIDRAMKAAQRLADVLTKTAPVAPVTGSGSAGESMPALEAKARQILTSTVPLVSKAGQVLNRANLTRVKAIHDAARQMGASMGADMCKD